MRRRIPMTQQEFREELSTAKRYLKNAEDEVADYHSRTDLIGRALADQVKRMKKILIRVKKGIPFGVGRNK